MKTSYTVPESPGPVGAVCNRTIGVNLVIFDSVLVP